MKYGIESNNRKLETLINSLMLERDKTDTIVIFYLIIV